MKSGRAFPGPFILCTKIILALVGLLIVTSVSRAQEANDSLHEKLTAGVPLLLDPQLPDSARSIKAEWLSEAVSKHVPVRVTNAIILGPLNLESATLEDEFAVSHSRFRGPVNLSYITAARRVNLSDNIFENDATFKGAALKGDADFQRDEFRASQANFSDARIDGIFNASGAHFCQGVRPNFSRASFSQTAFFQKGQFDNDANFREAHFMASTEFQGVDFKRRADFVEAKLDEDASFGAKNDFDEKIAPAQF